MAHVETGIRVDSNGDIDRMCRELFWEVEQKLIMHKLAKDYFGFRAFWMQSWPLLLITTFITIIAFTEYGSIISTNYVNYEEYSESRQILILSLAMLGLLSTFLTALIINTRYQSQHDMHVMAERALSKICQSVRFPQRSPGDDGTKTVEHINTQKAIFASVTCTAPSIPPRILHAFRDLEHVMCMKPYTFRAIQYERFYYFLWKSFSKRSCGYHFNLWPWIIPEIDVSSSVLGKVVDEEYDMYSRGMEKAKRRIRRLSFGDGEHLSHSTAPSSTSPSSTAEV